VRPRGHKQKKWINMSFNSLSLCPLSLTTKLNFNISKTVALLLVSTKNEWTRFSEHAQRIRFVLLANSICQICQIYGNFVNRGILVLDQPRAGRDSWCWPKGAQPLGMRMVYNELKSRLKAEIKALFSAQITSLSRVTVMGPLRSPSWGQLLASCLIRR